MYVAFKGQDLNKIWREIRVANLWWIGASVFSIILANILRALRWQMLYVSLRYKVGFLTILMAIYVGYLANLALPRFGELVRCNAVQRRAKVPLFLSIGTVITERLFDLLVLFLAGTAMLIFQYELVAEFLTANIYNNFLPKFGSRHFLLFAGCGIFVLILVCILFVFAFRGRFKSKLIRIYFSLRKGLTSYQKLKRKPLFLFYSVAIWVFYLLSIFAAFFSIESTSSLGLNAAFTAMIFSGLAMAAPVQGGIGIFHWMMAKCLLLYGIAFIDGLAYATLIYAAQLIPTIIVGAIGFWFVFGRKPMNDNAA